MNKELTKEDVVKLLRIWLKWMLSPDPANNKPDVFSNLENNDANIFSQLLGMGLHLMLWGLSKLGLFIEFPSLTVWAAKMRIKYDSYWFEPQSCGWNSAYTDLGLGYLKKGDIHSASHCLSQSWKVYPCPHNTSFGLKLKLYKKLKPFPKTVDSRSEYLEMWHRFNNVYHQLASHQNKTNNLR